MPDGSVLLTRYADVIAVYKDPKTFSSDKHEIAQYGWMRRCSSTHDSLGVQRSATPRVRRPDRGRA